MDARSKRHAFITVEHLLLGLLESPSVADALRACGANLDQLRRRLSQHVVRASPAEESDEEVDALMAILGRNDTIALRRLKDEGVQARDVANSLRT